MPHNDNDGLDVKAIVEEIVTTKDTKFFRDYIAEHMTGKNYYDVIKSLNKSNYEIIKDLVEHTPTKTLAKAVSHCLANGEITEERHNIFNTILDNCSEKKKAELLTVPFDTTPEGDLKGVNHNLGINVKTRANTKSVNR